MSDLLSPLTVEESSVPAAGRYEIDPSHSVVEFSIRHLGLARVRGRFTSFRGTLHIAEDPFESRLEATIDAASIDTSDPQRDGHLRSPDFLDVETHPQIQFHSTEIRQDGDKWLVDGELAVRDRTRPVTLSVEFEGEARDPWGNARLGLSAAAEVSRDEFGLTWNQPLEAGGWLVGKQVKIELSVEAVRQ